MEPPWARRRWLRTSAGHPTIVPQVFASTVSAADSTKGLLQKMGAGQTGEFTPLDASGAGPLRYADSLTQNSNGFLLANQAEADGSRVIKRFGSRYRGASGHPDYVSGLGPARLLFQRRHRRAPSESGVGERLYVASGAKIERFDLTARSYVDTFASLSGSHDFGGLAFSQNNADLFVRGPRRPPDSAI